MNPFIIVLGIQEVDVWEDMTGERVGATHNGRTINTAPGGACGMRKTYLKSAPSNPAPASQKKSGAIYRRAQPQA